MRYKSVFLASCAIALVSCNGQGGNTAAGENAAEAGTGNGAGAENATEVADGAIGVSSDGKQYDPVQTGDTADGGADAGAAGSGETLELESSDAEMSSLLALRGIDSPFGPTIIIDKDDRTRVADTTTFPERANVMIALPGGRCSGALIGKDLVITAGHCVHGGKGGKWVASATIYPGRNGRATPYGSCAAKKFYSVLGWTRDGNSAYDFGAIKLNCDVGNRTGWLGFFSQSASLIGKQARISSYPGDKPLEQWTHTDQVRQETALQTFYQTDTMPGNSGSGVFASAGVPAGCKGPCIHTVHTHGNAGAKRNGGTRITRPLFDNLVRWKAE